MKTQELFSVAQPLAVEGALLQSVLGVTADSRMAGPGDLFVAVTGTRTDGHCYLEQALAQGAAGVVVSDPEALTGPGFRLLVADTRLALSRLALALAGHPEKRLQLVGITGTNGKTTTAHLLGQLLEESGAGPVGVVGTLGGRVGGQYLSHDLTTPDPVTLARLLARIVNAGARVAVMEVSSHAVVQGRILGLEFTLGVLTNISNNEHLDFHGDFESYVAAKLSFFQNFVDSMAVINADDPLVEHFARSVSQPHTYGLISSADFRATDVRLDFDGATFRLVTPAGEHAVRIPLLGRVNVLNILAALQSAACLGQDLGKLVQGTPMLRAVRGRLEPVRRGQPFEVLIDFAHTSGALKEVLTFLRSLQPKRLLVVFGSGGDRDRSKRPKMGEQAAHFCDEIVLTSDNPRNEDPEEIADEVARGFGDRVYHRELDRRAAITLAMEIARPGDIVLIAGKGHETFQEIAGQRLPFDDRLVVEETLRGMGFLESHS